MSLVGCELRVLEHFDGGQLNDNPVASVLCTTSDQRHTATICAIIYNAHGRGVWVSMVYHCSSCGSATPSDP